MGGWRLCSKLGGTEGLGGHCGRLAGTVGTDGSSEK